jgi:bacteriophage N4 adsorption protein B
MTAIDSWILASLIPLGLWIIVSGIDDLFLDFVCLLEWTGQRLGKRKAIPSPGEQELEQLPQARIAIFVPLWKEYKVIARMVEHNLAAIRYQNFDIFIGVYPNDIDTVRAAHTVEARFTNVHTAMTPHDGPTSKADNLNWTYQRMLLYEEEHGCKFDIVITHDAEDLIHPESLRWINYYMQWHDMVQIPVLAMKTPIWQITHGVYCDEFAEYQTRDMLARQLLGGFIPSSGVGTGFSREALAKLAAASSNLIFEPASLTEDYENGLRLHRLGASQLFVPIRRLRTNFVATWELFPHSFWPAVRQRSRWVTGIALQSWARNGWSRKPGESYWMWRDRKGLVGNLVSMFANLILTYGAVTWVWSVYAGTPWGLAAMGESTWSVLLLWVTLFFQLWRIGFRMACASRVYGWAFSAWVPLRVFWSNWINSFATIAALRRYALMRLRGHQLVWIKTDHAYPSREALIEFRPPLGQIMVRSGFLTERELEEALALKPADQRLGQYLIEAGKLTEEQVYEALSIQQNLPVHRLAEREVPKKVARTLPAAVIETWKVLPFRVEAGELFLAGPELPTLEMREALRNHVSLNLRFHLITPSNYRELTSKLL